MRALVTLKDIKALDERATVFTEHGTVFVGVSYGDLGRLILGWGKDTFEAYDMARTRVEA